MKLFTRAWLLSLLCAVGFGVIAVLIGDRKIAEFDNTLISWIQGMEHPTLTTMMKFFTNIGTGLPIVVITILVMIVLYVGLGHRRELFLFTGIVVGSALLNLALKHAFGRARPTIHRIVEANGYSFPSGHSMAAFSLYGVLAFLLWKHISTVPGRIVLIVISTLLILAIGVSRIYLGVHYPSDVLGGYLASGSWLAISIWVYQRYLERR